jgi:hypothetical protein
LPFHKIPLVNYTGTNFPTNVTAPTTTDATTANFDVIKSLTFPKGTPQGLQYSVTSSDTSVLTASLLTTGPYSNNRLQLTGIKAGTATVTLTITDAKGSQVTASFKVTVA